MFGNSLSDDQIPLYPGRMAYRQYFERAGSGIAALAVNYTTGAETTFLPVVVLGPAFVTQVAMGHWFDFYQNKGGWEKFRQDGLVHEFLHVALQKDDEALATFLGRKEKGDDWTDHNSAGLAIQLFSLNDCKDETREIILMGYSYGANV